MQAINSTHSGRSERTLQLALFVTSATWFLASDVLAGRAARGISGRLNIDAARPLLEAFFLIFLLAVLFYKLLIVVSLFTINTASYINLLCNSATSYTEFMALREYVVVKVLYY